MASRPLVSVVTPTKGSDRWPVLFERCIGSVKAQTYEPAEHLIVSGDSWSDDLASRLAAQKATLLNSIEEDILDTGSQARNIGAAAARGQFIAYCDDDTSFRSDHVATLVQALLDHPEADFAYSSFVHHAADGHTEVRGGEPPIFGNIDCSAIMHRKDMLERFGEWPVPNLYPDAEAADRWTRNGAKWRFVASPTFDYYHITEGISYPGRERIRARGYDA